MLLEGHQHDSAALVLASIIAGCASGSSGSKANQANPILCRSILTVQSDGEFMNKDIIHFHFTEQT